MTSRLHIFITVKSNKCSCQLYKIISPYVETENIVQYFPHEALATELKFILRVRVRGTRRRGRVISAEQRVQFTTSLRVKVPITL